jgi:hypothetical protein
MTPWKLQTEKLTRSEGVIVLRMLARELEIMKEFFTATALFREKFGPSMSVAIHR